MFHQRLGVFYLLWLLSTTSLNAFGRFHGIVMKTLSNTFLEGDLLEIYLDESGFYSIIKMNGEKNKDKTKILPPQIKIIPRHGTVQDHCPDNQYIGKRVTLLDVSHECIWDNICVYFYKGEKVRLPRSCIEWEPYRYCFLDNYPPSEKDEILNVKINLEKTEEIKMEFKFIILPYCYRERFISLMHNLTTSVDKCRSDESRVYFVNYLRTPREHVYTINHLKPNCTYNVSFYMKFRNSSTDWTEFQRISATTKTAVAISDLSNNKLSIIDARNELSSFETISFVTIISILLIIIVLLSVALYRSRRSIKKLQSSNPESSNTNDIYNEIYIKQHQ